MKKPVDFFHRRLRFLLHRLVVPPYDATVVLDDTGKYVNYKLEFDQKKAGAKHE